MPTTLAKIRNSAFLNQSHRCYYCHLPMWHGNPMPFADALGLSLKQAMRLQCTAEHLTAKQDGGLNSKANIVAACRHCNQTRHRRANPLPPEQFKKLILRRLGMGRWHSSSLLSKLGR